MHAHALPQTATGQADGAALAAWYGPWRTLHAARADDPCHRWMGRDELQLRVRYRLWCEQMDLPLHPLRPQASTWWTLYALAPAAFEQVNVLAALVLAVAADRRNSLLLVRGAGALLPDGGDVKWALQRASLVPRPLLAHRDDDLQRHAGAMLAWILQRAQPCLASRMALRFAPPAAPAPVIEAAEAERCLRWLESLWCACHARIVNQERH